MQERISRQIARYRLSTHEAPGRVVINPADEQYVGATVDGIPVEHDVRVPRGNAWVQA